MQPPLQAVGDYICRGGFEIEEATGAFYHWMSVYQAKCAPVAGAIALGAAR
ncbi:MAG: hypothetical protein MUC60_01505 [Oscillatoria sp. Prado101]|nr:hypothetical protein [Oscillatoria sp. Prado101]